MKRLSVKDSTKLSCERIICTIITSVAYRAVKIEWTPRSKAQWATYSACRGEAARLWNDLIERHFRLRRAQWKWPSKGRLEKWAKGKYPNLHSQSVQQIIGEFLEAVDSAHQLRHQGTRATYPYRKSRFRDVIYTNQGARIRDGALILPNGKAGSLRIRMPSSVSLPGRLMEVRLGLFNLLLTCEVPDEYKVVAISIGVDLGVNSLIAATDGKKAVCISGRALKSEVRYRNKRLSSLSAKQSAHRPGARQWKRIQKRKRKVLAKNKRRLKDFMHKATRKVAREFPRALCYVGKPFNGAAEKMGRVTAQQVSQACNRKLIDMLNYKLVGAIEVSESYSSQTCPVCGQRSKGRRTYRCRQCGLTAPRDVVGAVNILSIGQHQALLRARQMPQQIIFKYAANFAASPADARHVARPSARSLRL